jgi:Asp-tRNA(Asn)/Glu-tRNA(Gln) amidotransferase B subunit
MDTKSITEKFNKHMAEALREAADILEEAGSTRITTEEAINQAVDKLMADSPFDFSDVVETEH